MEVLVYLANLDGQVATLESIHDDLWSGKVVSSGTIYNCIAELRQAFASGGSTIEYIETLPKKGYRLAPPIISRQVTNGTAKGRCSIAILPLANRSADPAIEYLCQGIADEILFGLSRVDGLNVYSASSLREENLDTRVVGLRFGAQKVLSGSLQSRGNKLRAILRLENVADGEIAWSGRFDETTEDLLELQDAIARQVILAISPALHLKPSNGISLDGSGTRSPEALNAFLLGKHALTRSTQEGQDEAIDYLERAVRIDPKFGRAHYMMYVAYYNKCRFFGGGQAAIEKARAAAQHAEDSGFRPVVPWIHILRRLYPERRIRSRALAVEAIEKLVSRDPEWASFAYEQLTWVLTDAGLFHAALDFAKHMFDSPELNFDDSDADEEVPHYAAACGFYDEAIQLWSELLQKEPARHLFRCERSILYARTGQFDYAARDLPVMVTKRHQFLAEAFVSYYQGDQEETKCHHEKLLGLPNVHPSYRTWTYCLVGDLDRGLDEYDHSVSDVEHSYIDFGNMRAMSRAKLPQALVEEIESHPKFTALMQREGIDDAWQAELAGRLNKISDLTGIVVQRDSASRGSPLGITR